MTKTEMQQTMGEDIHPLARLAAPRGMNMNFAAIGHNGPLIRAAMIGLCTADLCAKQKWGEHWVRLKRIVTKGILHRRNVLGARFFLGGFRGHFSSQPGAASHAQFRPS